MRYPTKLALAWGLVLCGGCGQSEAGETPAAAKPAVSESAATQVASSASGSEPAAAPPRPKLPAVVTLDGSYHPWSNAVVQPGRPRIYSKSLRTWIYERPSRQSRRLGYLRAGASSPTSKEPAGHDRCKLGWYPVEPDGYVCVGGRATLDPKDPVVVATQELQPDPSRKLPYIYGTVRKAGPVYARLPGGEALRKAEPDIDERMPEWLDAGGEIGASYAQDVWLGGSGTLIDPAKAWQDKATDPLPSFLRDGGSTPNIYRKPRGDDLIIDRMGHRVGYSFLQTFLFEGRRYGLTTDLRVMPTDRLRPIQGSDHHGVQIGKEVELPFVFVRRENAKFWLYQKSANKLIDAGAAPYWSAHKLTGKQQFFNKRLHYETVDGKWISDRDGSRLDPAKRMPAWGKNGEKWMDVNLTKQTVVLYEGTKPVYATLISSGEAGLEDPAHTTATKRGIFRIHTKHVAVTMSSDEVGEAFELRDVPYVQYFDKEGYALHGAYWHDRFGTPKSHGCINLTPEDARRIFHWTEPQVPLGWHGVLLPLKGTVMFVHP
ncbi:MAG: L,D-transpeptidase [Polyangiaceae bacterium]